MSCWIKNLHLVNYTATHFFIASSSLEPYASQIVVVNNGQFDYVDVFSLPKPLKADPYSDIDYLHAPTRRTNVTMDDGYIMVESPHQEVVAVIACSTGNIKTKEKIHSCVVYTGDQWYYDRSMRDARYLRELLKDDGFYSIRVPKLEVGSK